MTRKYERGRLFCGQGARLILEKLLQCPGQVLERFQLRFPHTEGGMGIDATDTADPVRFRILPKVPDPRRDRLKNQTMTKVSVNIDKP